MSKATSFSPLQQPGSRPTKIRDLGIACGLFVGFLVLYHLNGDFLVGRDAEPNIYLPVSVLQEGNFVFTPEEMPLMFTWVLETGDGRRRIRFDCWDGKATGDETFRECYDAGKLRPLEPAYYLVQSKEPDSRTYVNQYGPGTGLTALPFFAVQSLFTTDLAHNKGALWHGGKFVASFCVAVSVAVVFLAALQFAGRPAASVIALAYGAGTCVWSVASQTLLQSGPNVMFISLAAYCLLRIGSSSLWAAGSGLAAACGVICRPTTALVVLAIGAYLLAVALKRWRDKSDPANLLTAARPLLVFLLAGLPLAIGLAYWNWHHFGSPLAFGQTMAGQQIAEGKLGSTDVWQGKILQGLCGLMVSPSRGMLVYSPILVFAFWGAVRLWREPGLGRLRPLSIAVVLLLLLHASWFDWYGGWSYGYRLVISVTPLLALCSVAVAETVRRRKVLLVLFLASLVWSVGVQVIGAYAYNMVGWNNRRAHLVELPGEQRPFLVLDRHQAEEYANRENARVEPICLNVDRKCFRYRLWSLDDCQLLYYVTHLEESRRLKRRLTASCLEGGN